MLDELRFCQYNSNCSVENHSTKRIEKFGGCTGFDGDYEVREATCGSEPH